MLNLFRILPAVLLILPFSLKAQETHDHGVPEQLGKVSFPISCSPTVQQEFERGVALLHSFGYAVAEDAFRRVAERDPHCAMAHWGIAMTHFHQLWEPPLSPSVVPIVQQELQMAQQLGNNSGRERKFIQALSLVVQDAGTVPYRTRALNYQRAMSELASENPRDAEAQIFFALALLANASPADKMHANQKQAAGILEPLYRAHPQHPGIPHYLIHAYDNAELASKGLPAARAYSRIASSAPHALHMPAHIFTRLGLWEDSISSNLAARDAAHKQGDTGEELHAMDYLVYAYLQSGRNQEAAAIIEQLGTLLKLNYPDFKIGYAATVMPVRYAVERRQWADAAKIVPLTGAQPQVAAIAIWARGIGLAKSGREAECPAEIEKLLEIKSQLRNSGNDYWATQVEILGREVMAWSAEARGKPEEAAALLRMASDEEDALEKLPITPGPVVPAREQLGYLLLEQNHPDLAKKEFETALANAPGRKGALEGAAQAAAAESRK